jgi:hypothetical protein
MRAAALPAMHRLASRFPDAVSRAAHRLPAPVRARLRGLVAWWDQRRLVPPIDDWSRPLIGTESACTVPRYASISVAEAFTRHEVAAPARSDNSAGAGGAGLPAARCLLVTCLCPDLPGRRPREQENRSGPKAA